MLIQGNRQTIEIEVADRVFGDTIIKQKALFNSLYHYQSENGVSSATISVVVKAYALLDGGYGDYLGHIIQDRNITLEADNNTLVDMQTGDIIAIKLDSSDEEWDLVINGFPDDQPVMLQGDFFEYLRENAPILIGEMIRKHILAANGYPFYKFA